MYRSLATTVDAGNGGKKLNAEDTKVGHRGNRAFRPLLRCFVTSYFITPASACKKLPCPRSNPSEFVIRSQGRLFMEYSLFSTIIRGLLGITTLGGLAFFRLGPRFFLQRSAAAH